MSVQPDLGRLEEILDGFRRVRLLVLGDLVLDEYVWGEVERVSPEAPVPVVQVRRESVVLGGAGNVLRNVQALGASGSICAVVGDDADGHLATNLVKELGVEPVGILRVRGRPTTRKTRVVARGQQIVRFDRESVEPLPEASVEEADRVLAGLVPAAGGVVIQDYGKGFLTEPLVHRAMKRFAHAALPVAVDPKRDLESFCGASLLKPNRREAEALTGVEIRDDADLARAVSVMRRAIGGGDVVVTGGAEGMSLFEQGGTCVPVATARREVFDVQGAGDTSLAVLALAVRSGASLLEAALLANAAAGVVIEKIGTATASAEEVRASLPASLAAAGVSL